MSILMSINLGLNMIITPIQEVVPTIFAKGENKKFTNRDNYENHSIIEELDKPFIFHKCSLMNLDAANR